MAGLENSKKLIFSHRKVELCLVYEYNNNNKMRLGTEFHAAGVKFTEFGVSF